MLSLSVSCATSTSNARLSSSGPVPPSTDASSAFSEQAPRSFDRSANLILFGLPESSLLNTISEIDDISTHLVGRTIKVKDAFRLGRKPSVEVRDNVDGTKQGLRPRPLLIKCESVWERRLLLASRRNLKNFEKYKLFLREDLLQLIETSIVRMYLVIQFPTPLVRPITQ